MTIKTPTISNCRHWLGCSAANRMQGDLGRLAGSRTTRPARPGTG